MGYIYIITNDINDKAYIGKTYGTIQKRWREHCNDSIIYGITNGNRPLYNAINTYGIEHFNIQLLEEVQATNNLEEREIYWITKLNTYYNGYNATLGGDGKPLYDYEEIKNILLTNYNAKETAEKVGCCIDIVYKVAHMYDIDLLSYHKGNQNFLDKSKIVDQYSKDNKFIQSFSSVADAARWCYENNKCKTLNSGVRTHISDVCNYKPKRKTAYGYIWKYREMDMADGRLVSQPVS